MLQFLSTFSRRMTLMIFSDKNMFMKNKRNVALDNYFSFNQLFIIKCTEANHVGYFLNINYKSYSDFKSVNKSYFLYH